MKFSALVEEALVEELRDIAWWSTGATLTNLVTEALEDFIKAAREKEITLVDPDTGKLIAKPAGKPYPRRRAELTTGRPLS